MEAISSSTQRDKRRVDWRSATVQQRVPPWMDQSRLVRERDELGAVAGVHLAERPADVGLRGREADNEPLGDLVVAQTARDERHHLTLASRELLELLRARPVVVRLRSHLGDEAPSTPRDRSASPRATARTASSSCVGSVSFTRKPLAPARRAPNSSSSPSEGLRTITRTLWRAGSEKIRRVVWRPSVSGRSRSIRTTSGALARPSRGPRRRRRPLRRQACPPRRRAAR